MRGTKRLPHWQLLPQQHPFSGTHGELRTQLSANRISYCWTHRHPYHVSYFCAYLVANQLTHFFTNHFTHFFTYLFTYFFADCVSDHEGAFCCSH